MASAKQLTRWFAPSGATNRSEKNQIERSLARKDAFNPRAHGNGFAMTAIRFGDITKGFFNVGTAPFPGWFSACGTGHSMAHTSDRKTPLSREQVGTLIFRGENTAQSKSEVALVVDDLGRYVETKLGGSFQCGNPSRSGKRREGEPIEPSLEGT